MDCHLKIDVGACLLDRCVCVRECVRVCVRAYLCACIDLYMTDSLCESAGAIICGVRDTGTLRK